MYIKEVTIQGFRSYKDQTAVEPFSSKHNVVVGKNGSGKSNFFKAIQFVLGDESEFGARLGADSRQSLLHEGTGNKVHTAYAEVVFDNTDGRIPVEGDEVVIRRTISAKQDQYTLNGKTATKQDVANLFETAGFSKSNPYYIVKQGKVNELSTAPVEKRLNLLKEVAGTKVYDERRAESQEAMKETSEKSEQIHKAISNMEDRLKTLEEEKEELKKYQHLDKKRRVLEHTVFTKDLEEVRAKVSALEIKSEEKDTSLKGLRAEMRKFGDEIQKVEKVHRETKSKVAQFEEEKRQVLQELEEHHHRETQLELSIKDCETDDEQVKSNKRQWDRELRDLRDKIEQTEIRLQQLAPQYNEAVAEQDAVNKDLQTKKQQRSELFAKQNRGDRFRSKEERDKWLSTELKRVGALITDKSNTLKAAEKKLDGDRQKIKQLENSINGLEKAVTEKSEQYKRDQIVFYEDKRAKEELVGTRNDLWRKQHSLQEELNLKKDELRKRKNDLQSQMGKSILRGVDGVRMVMNEWNEDQNKQEYVQGYHGLLIDCIVCDEMVYTAVDTVAGNKLFYHVVDTDTIAAKILEEVNRRNLPGEFNFLPLNRLSVKEVEYPDLGDVEALPLINKISSPQEVERAVKFIFGKTLVCRYLELATDLCKQYNMDCVTPDGDTASRRGTMTGGYLNRRESRMMLQKYIREITKEEQRVQEQLDEVKTELDKYEADLQDKNNKLSSLETKLERIKAQNERNKIELGKSKEEFRSLQNGIEPREKSIAEIRTEIAVLETTKHTLEQERGTELTSVLSDSERRNIDSLDAEIRNLTKQMQNLSEKRRNLEMQKSNLQNSLQDNLKRREDELKGSIQESTAESSGHRLLSLKQERDMVNRAVAKLQNDIVELDKKLDELIDQRRNTAAELERLRSKERELQEKILAESRELDKIINRLVLMQKEKDECLHKIRELSALPAGVDNSEYMKKSARELGRDLDKVNEELKKFGHVNQRALDQYVTFSEQRTKLLSRRDELDRGEKSIADLMDNLEHQKYEAITRTFQQVTRNFELVFKELVPQGRGLLTLLKGSEESTVEDTQPSMEELNKFTGIGVKVTFTGGTGEMKDMNQLSGGQKTLVALATIFAIQKCDPAPFYLFDEIDQNLDPDHRKSVGRMIERLSNNAQFITTTFRSELLEHADKFYGVKYDPNLKVSRIQAIKKQEAQDFIADDESQGNTELASSSNFKNLSANGSLQSFNAADETSDVAGDVEMFDGTVAVESVDEE